jgi:hypothetical protein
MRPTPFGSMDRLRLCLDFGETDQQAPMARTVATMPRPATPAATPGAGFVRPRGIELLRLVGDTDARFRATPFPHDFRTDRRQLGELVLSH